MGLSAEISLFNLSCKLLLVYIVPIRDEIIHWLEIAKADLRHAESSIKIGDYNWACFAAQQAAEKALKALAMYLLGEYPRGNDLVKL